MVKGGEGEEVDRGERTEYDGSWVVSEDLRELRRRAWGGKVRFVDLIIFHWVSVGTYAY